MRVTPPDEGELALLEDGVPCDIRQQLTANVTKRSILDANRFSGKEMTLKLLVPR